MYPPFPFEKLVEEGFNDQFPYGPGVGVPHPPVDKEEGVSGHNLGPWVLGVDATELEQEHDPHRDRRGLHSWFLRQKLPVSRPHAAKGLGRGQGSG